MWSPLYPIRSRSVFGEKVDVVPVTVTGILFQRNRFEFCRVQKFFRKFPKKYFSTKIFRSTQWNLAYPKTAIKYQCNDRSIEFTFTCPSWNEKTRSENETWKILFCFENYSTYPSWTSRKLPSGRSKIHTREPRTAFSSWSEFFSGLAMVRSVVRLLGRSTTEALNWPKRGCERDRWTPGWPMFVAKF